MYFKVHLSQVSNLTHDFKLAPDFKTMAMNSKLWPRIQNYGREFKTMAENSKLLHS